MFAAATTQPPTGAAAPESAMASMLRMSVGGQILAVPIDDVREILEVGRMTPLPRTPDFVRGVMNLRGAVVPVLDLAARLGLGVATLGRRSCVVIVESADIEEPDTADTGAADDAQPLVVGLLVDAVYEVFDAAGDTVETVPALGTVVPAHFLAGMTRARGEVVGVLALGRVLARRELADSIGAGQAN